jgi:hypothetical protein
MNALATPTPNQRVRRAVTTAAGPSDAAAELQADLSQADASLVVLFCSPRLALDDFATDLKRRFGDTPVIGCTTAGEITPFGYQHGSVTGVSFASPDFFAAARHIPDIRHFSVSDGRNIVRSCIAELEGKAPDLPHEQIFAILFIDGLDATEESVISALHHELGPIPLFGGSAGDELDFRTTRILFDGAFHQHGAVLVLVATTHPFRVFKTEHFTLSQEKMVITAADPIRRVVTEINAEPAAREYARLIGLTREQLTPTVFATHPLVVRVGNVPYVRALQKANADDSLTFFSSIDEGIVLTAATGTDIVEDMTQRFEELRAAIGQPEVVIGCDCILRNLEIKQKGLEQAMADLFRDNHVVGFNTYGEQFNAMHVNQTFTGVAIGRRQSRES